MPSADLSVVAVRSTIDFDRLSFVDSCGLWSISSVCSTCRQRGIGIRLWPGPPNVQNVFEVTGLYDVLPFTAAGPPRPARSRSDPSAVAGAL